MVRRVIYLRILLVLRHMSGNKKAFSLRSVVEYYGDTSFSDYTSIVKKMWNCLDELYSVKNNLICDCYLVDVSK